MEKDCLFCKIIKGEITSYKIYENKHTFAFLDISNDGNGHILVVPKVHCENILDCDNEVLNQVLGTVKLISQHLVNKCGFEGVNVANNSGKSAEQSVMHLHFHILPRKKEDNFKFFPNLPDCEYSMEENFEKFKISEKIDDAKEIVLYTDGACSGNPGIGGWGAILFYKGKEKILSGGEILTTNNRMELMAVIKGLEAIKEGCKVDVYSDSAYVVNAFEQKWIEKWQSNGWKSSKGDVLNMDLWQKLLAEMERHQVLLHKVKGHSDNENNNKCDALARGEIEKLRKNQ